jgi:lipid-A-disaccharide synthase
MKIAISIAETSGDVLGAKLIQSIKNHYPNAEIVGMVGEKSKSAGAIQLWDSSLVSVMGLVEVLKKLPQIWLLRQKIIKHFLKNKPDVFIGVDSPDFNFAIEKKLKEKGIKTIHFVSPSVWAWREKRIEKIKKSTDIMLCLFPFEVDFYKKHSMSATFVGHPLTDIEPRTNYQIQKHIALMPGSRRAEIEKILPTMIKTANNILRLDNDYKFNIVLADDKNLDLVKHWVKGDKITYSIGNAYEIITDADLAVVASGTASLEVALIGTPQVVVYKLNNLTYKIVKNKLRTKFVSLPNVILGKSAIMELLQDNYNQSTLANAIFKTLKSADLQLQHFAKIRPMLSADFDSKIKQVFDEL